MSTAPYRHADGSNCWTKNCSRNNSGGAFATDAFQNFLNEWAGRTDLTPTQTLTLAERLKLFPAANRIRKGEAGMPSHSDRDRRYELRELLGKESYDTINFYMQYEYEKVNASLRGGQAWKDFLAKDREEKVVQWGQKEGEEWSEEILQKRADESINKLDVALAKLNRLIPPTTQLLYRYEFAPKGFTHADALAKFKVGEVIEDPAYTSTTPDPNLMVSILNTEYHMKDKEMYVYEIVSDRGINIYESNGFGGRSDEEQEVLIPRGSRYRVHRIFEAPYQTGHTPAEQERLGYYGYRDHWKKPVTKKRLTVIQLIDVTNEA